MFEDQYFRKGYRAHLLLHIFISDVLLVLDGVENFVGTSPLDSLLVQRLLPVNAVENGKELKGFCILVFEQDPQFYRSIWIGFDQLI